MSSALLLVSLIVVAALAFDFSNGWHDAANSIATVVSTRVLSPRYAVVWAAFFNFIAAFFFGTAVASTIGKGMLDIEKVTQGVILCGLLGAIVWNLITWFFGLPTSSSHALIGGLCGSAIAYAHGDWNVLHWRTGLLPKVVVPMFTSPLVGFVVGGMLMFILTLTLRAATPHLVHSIFGKLQLISAAWMAHSHGTNDAQKTMGIITLALFTATTG